MDDFLFAGWKNGALAIRRNAALFLLTFIMLLPAQYVSLHATRLIGITAPAIPTSG